MATGLLTDDQSDAGHADTEGESPLCCRPGRGWRRQRVCDRRAL